MARKVISSGLIVAICLTTCGCGSMRSIEKFPTNSDLVGEKTTEAVLTNGDQIVFDKVGATYQLGGFVAGKTTAGTSLKIPFRDVTTWKYSVIDSATGARVESEVHTPLYAAFIDTTIHVSAVRLSNQVWYAFRNDGGRVSGTKDIIIGVEAETKVFRIVPVDSVLYMRMDRLDEERAVRSVIGLFVFVPFVAFLILHLRPS